MQVSYGYFFIQAKKFTLEPSAQNLIHSRHLTGPAQVRLHLIKPGRAGRWEVAGASHGDHGFGFLKVAANRGGHGFPLELQVSGILALSGAQGGVEIRRQASLPAMVGRDFLPCRFDGR